MAIDIPDDGSADDPLAGMEIPPYDDSIMDRYLNDDVSPSPGVIAGPPIDKLLFTEVVRPDDIFPFWPQAIVFGGVIDCSSLQSDVRFSVQEEL